MALSIATITYLFRKLKPKSQPGRRMKRPLSINGGDDRVELPVPNDFGDGGVWQRTILKGGKCQSLDMSGVIYYDTTGKPIEKVPATPRA
ncbi:hypothetical protein HS088_TW20G00627 [Tripterygium wilfordii]|uniref:Uncharacterized protein n=1 Tax=Tripterygium wilfordii TaxID=458696 RepID=A0A7J7C7Y7_TRIWF|nr:hypothetical protein HS088_TW20G00627 [Tripterygium wilfordii]